MSLASTATTEAAASQDRRVGQAPGRRSFLLLSLLVVIVTGGVFAAVLFALFPLFVPAPELLILFPPDEIAVAREEAFRFGRLANTLTALGVCSFVLACLLPAALVMSRRIPHQASRKIVPYALAATLITGLGVVSAHLVMEFSTPSSLGLLRTFLAHWLEFSFFGAGIGLAVGAALAGRRGARELALRGAAVGFTTATLFDMVCVVIPRAQVDSLFPGGVIWGNKDGVALGLWVSALMLCVLLTVAAGVKQQPVAEE